MIQEWNSLICDIASMYGHDRRSDQTNTLLSQGLLFSIVKTKASEETVVKIVGSQERSVCDI